LARSAAISASSCASAFTIRSTSPSKEISGSQPSSSRALLGSQSYEWTRPFRSGEEVDVTVRVERAWEKNSTEFAVVASEFSEPSGELIQRQTTTFIERAPG